MRLTSEELKARCLGSFLFFTQFFYKLRTGRNFNVSRPEGRESHHIALAKALTDFFNLRYKGLNINIEPGASKSEFCKHFIAWAWAWYPDCQSLYISYSADLATSHTAGVRDIVEMPEYQRLFDVHIHPEFRSRDFFKTTAGGALAAFGSSGSITGRDAGLMGIEDRFSGCVIMDDMHKADEVDSDSLRETVITNYVKAITSRPRGDKVPLLNLGQRLHPKDISAYFIDGKDNVHWDSIVFKSLDEFDRPLNPKVHSKEFLVSVREKQRHLFYSQYQQDPEPEGTRVYKEEDFVVLSCDPDNIHTTFLTLDAAETDKTYNDASAVSFWGIYDILVNGQNAGTGLHWIDCEEVWLEPRDLEVFVSNFLVKCMRYRVKPSCCWIEKKSVGTTLASKFKDFRGLKVLPVDRNITSGSKNTRFLSIQGILSEKVVSLPKVAQHTAKCIKHCCSITNNGTQDRDDIADTLFDAVRVVFIDKLIGQKDREEKRSLQYKYADDILKSQTNISTIRRKHQWNI